MIYRGDIEAEHKDPGNFPYKRMQTAPVSGPGTNLPWKCDIVVWR